MKKVIITLLALLIVPLVLAQNGCFLNGESDLYCKPISFEESKEECLLLDNCNLQTDFNDQPCDQLSQCKKILCKSSCNERYRKDCPAGEIPKTDKLLWCSPGCCQFNYLDQNFCDYKEKKWLCQVEAINKHASKLNFNNKLSQTKCQTVCGQDLETRKKHFTSLSSEPVKKKMLINKVKSEKLSSKVEEKEETSNILIFILIFFLIIAALLYFYRKKLSFPKMTKKEVLSKKWTHVLVPKSGSEKRIEEMKKKHQLKIKEKRREQYFTEVGLPIKKDRSKVDKLSTLVRIHQKAKEKLIKEKPWKDLKKVIEKKGIPKKKKDEVIDDLRKMTK